MNNLEFVLTNANTTINDVEFINTQLIPHYKFLINLGTNSINICHSNTNEVRNINLDEIITLLEEKPKAKFRPDFTKFILENIKK